MPDKIQLADVARKESSSSASNYIQYSAQQQNASEELSKRVLAHFNNREYIRVYDVGCGTGHLLKTLSSQGYKGTFWGSDYSRERIRLARKQNQPADLEGKIRYQTKDAQHACQMINTFDVLFATSMLHHVPEKDHAGVFSQFFNTLRAGGYLGIVTYGPNMPLDSAIKAFILAQGNKYALEGFESPRVYLSTEQYCKNLENAGFVIVSDMDKTNLVSSEKEPLKCWLKGWLPSYQYLSIEKNEQDLAELYLTELCAHLHQQFPNGIPIPHIELVATKPYNELDHAVAFSTRAQNRKREFEGTDDMSEEEPAKSRPRCC